MGQLLEARPDVNEDEAIMTKTTAQAPAGVAPTQTVAVAMAAMEQLITRQQGMPGLAVLSGKPGLGKTSAITRLAHPVDYNALYIACKPFDTSKSLVATLLKELGAPHKAHWSVREMFDEALSALVQQNRPLVVDEVDYIAKTKVIEVLRTLHDVGAVSILMVGEDDLKRTLARYHERFHDRVLVWASAVLSDLSDLDKLAQVYAPGLKLQTEAKKTLVNRSGGVARKIVTALHNLREQASRRGLESIGVEDVSEVLA